MFQLFGILLTGKKLLKDLPKNKNELLITIKKAPFAWFIPARKGL